MRPLVPVDAKTQDWPRKVANAVNDLLRELEALKAANAALEARVTALETP